MRSVSGKARIDLAVDPPPDLVIEIDIAHPSLDKLPLYAAAVPEVWRYADNGVTIYRLAGDAYHRQEQVSSYRV